MQNVISVDKYSFFLDEHVGSELEEDFVVFETNRAMSGTEVSVELGVSRMAVSQTLKRALKKIYFSLRKGNKHLDSFDVAVMMSELLNVSLDNETEVNKFFNLFPSDIQKEIENYARKRIRSFAEAMC